MQSRLNIRAHYFANRIVNIWNSLPDAIVTSPTLNTFKNRLDTHWHDFKYMELTVEEAIMINYAST